MQKKRYGKKKNLRIRGKYDGKKKIAIEKRRKTIIKKVEP